MRRRIIAVLTSLALGTGVAVASLLAGPAQEAFACSQFFHVTDSNGLDQVENSNNFNGGVLCINNTGGTSNLTVHPGNGNLSQDQVHSYPNIKYGCGFPPDSFCTTGSPFPKQVSSLGNLTTRWIIDRSGVSAASKYDSALDLFFSPTSAHTTVSSEVMVWANRNLNPIPPGAVDVTINSITYHRFVVHQTRSNFSWDEVIYARFPMVDSFNTLNIKPILDNAVSAGLGLTNSMYSIDFSCGLEAYNNGDHWAETDCRVTNF
jgi:hypothetical protein